MKEGDEKTRIKKLFKDYFKSMNIGKDEAKLKLEDISLTASEFLEITEGFIEDELNILEDYEIKLVKLEDYQRKIKNQMS